MLLNSLTLFAQNVTVRGTVTDANAEPIIGATIVVKGDAARGTATDVDGKYTLTNVSPDAVLEVSYVGMKTQEIAVNGRTTINIVMKDDSELLDEVVVVGFGTQKKVNLTGAVSTVKAEDISSRPVANITQALQGLVPGMNFSYGREGDKVGSSMNINVRGIGTLNTKVTKASPLVLIDGVEGDINILNPNDVENISVLKDAAASSIYGSRAPYGVILITTKRGKAGKTVVNYNNNFRFLSPLNMPKMADSYSYALYFNDAQPDGSRFSDAKLKQIKEYRDDLSKEYMWKNPGNNRWEVWDSPSLLPAGNTDWLDTHFGGSHFTQEHALSMTGGNEKVQYYVSGNYLDQGGLLNYGDDNKQRYSLNGKINAQLTDKISMGYNIRFVRADYDAPSYMDDLFYHNICRYWPIIPLKDPNGFFTGDSKVYQLTEGGRYTTQNDQLVNQLNFLLEPIKNWKINVELNYKSGYSFEHTDKLTTYAYDVNKNPFVYDNATSSVKEYAYKFNFFNPNIYTEYLKEFESGHTVKGMIGFQSELYKDRSITASKDGVQVPSIPTLNTTERNPLNSGGYGHWTTLGYFGRLNYDYKGRYLAEVNLRYDGSSRFLEDQRWNLFPSFSLGWNVARESFFEDYLNTINTFKLRGSWGELGNQNTDTWYPFYRTIQYNKNNKGEFTQGDWLLNGSKPNIAYEGSLVSALLTWERIRTTNIGVDLGMFRNRLTASFDWFLRQSLNMVGPAPELPETLGIGVPRINNLNMESQGFELMISWRDQINDFRYGASLNIADSRQKITKYPNPAKVLSQNYYEGAYVGDIWGFETIGIAKTKDEMDQYLASLKNGGQSALGSNWNAGDIMFKDLDGNDAIDKGEGTVDKPGDRRIIGNSTPRYNFGLNLDAAWKGFDLKVFFQGVMKRDYMPRGVMFWGAHNGLWQSVAYEPHLNYFRNDPKHPLGQNLDAYYPQPNWNDKKNRQTQTKYLQNAAYCRLKNVTLGYTLPTQLTQKISVNNLRLFVSGENLLTITKLSKMFDPETLGIGYGASWNADDGKTYPLSQTVSLGVSITF